MCALASINTHINITFLPLYAVNKSPICNKFFILNCNDITMYNQVFNWNDVMIFCTKSLLNRDLHIQTELKHVHVIQRISPDHDDLWWYNYDTY